MLEKTTHVSQKIPLSDASQRYLHPSIHISERFSYYSFPVLASGLSSSERLITIDSNSEVYPTEQIGPKMAKELLSLEKQLAASSLAASSLSWRKGFPVTLLSEEAQRDALMRLRRGFPAEIPFRDRSHQRKFRIWCLLTYLFPILRKIPFLRVRVPDISSARNMERLLQQSCFNGLVVNDATLKDQIRGHRRAVASTVIFSPEPRTGRHPGFALEYLEHLPRGKELEPPLALIEIFGMGWSLEARPGWIVDVELSSPLESTPLDGDWHHLGCAMALFDRSALVRDMLAHPSGPARWLESYLFGEQMTLSKEGEAEVGEGDPPAGAAVEVRGIDKELTRHVESVWAGCLLETGGMPTSTCRQCNTLCLHQRLVRMFPELEEQLMRMGWRSKGFKRRLLEHGVIVSGVRNMSGCLSNLKSPEWKGKGRNGIVVPDHRLPPEHRGE